MVIVIPGSDHARNSQICLEPCRALARSLNFGAPRARPTEWAGRILPCRG
jgi:hypothetical protein